MPSTYTTNLGIEKIGTGEQSGTWGTTTNTNFDLIDQGVNGIVQVTLAAVGSTGSPNALTIDNGALSDGRNKFIEFVDGGDLGGTAYVQLQPNDSEKVAFIRNSLSGSRSIIIFQGTYNASNDFEIPNGADVVLKFDGAGASATVTQVFENLTVSSATLASGVTVNAILDEDNMASDSDTALATQQSIKAYVDSQVTAQDLDIAGDTGTGAVDLDSQSLTIAGTANEIETSASGQTITVGLPNAVTIADLTATTADINGGTIDGTVIGGSSAAAGSFTTLTATSANVNGTVTADGLISNVFGNVLSFNRGDTAVAGVLKYVDATTSFNMGTTTSHDFNLISADTVRLTVDSGGNVGIGTASPSEKLEIFGNVILTTGYKIYGNANTGLTSSYLSLYNAVDGGIDLMANYTTSKITFGTAGSERMRIDASGNVGIGTSSPSSALDVNGQLSSATAGTATIGYTFGGQATKTGMGCPADGTLSFYAGTSTERMRIDSSGRLGIGNTSPSYKLSVGDGTADTRSVFASNNAFSIGVSNASGFAGWIGGSGVTDNMVFSNSGGTERMRIDSSGNVGIGTTSFASALSVATNGGAWTTSSSDGVGVNYNSGNANISTYLDNSTLQIGAGATQKNGIKIYGQTGGNRIEFQVAGSERARIDSSGNLLVGTTDGTPYASNVKGAAFYNSGAISGSVDGLPAMYLNRKTSDGTIADFRKDGTTVGSIGADGGDLFIGTGDTGIRFSDSGNAIVAQNPSTVADSDAFVDLGTSGIRFKDLYLSGGVYLGGTGAANHLDDYEEGTFVAIIEGTTTAGTATYTTQKASYVKKGKSVTYQIYLSYTGHTGTGNMRVSGLPFTAVGGGYISPASVYVDGNLTLPAISVVQGYVNQGSTNVILSTYVTGGGNPTLLAIDSAASIAISGSYEAA